MRNFGMALFCLALIGGSRCGPAGYVLARQGTAGWARLSLSVLCHVLLSSAWLVRHGKAGMIWVGQSWLVCVWHGLAWLGRGKAGLARQCLAWFGKAERGKAGTARLLFVGYGREG